MKLTPNGGAQPTDVLTSRPGAVQTSPSLTLPDFREVRKKHRTIGRAVKAYLEPFRVQIPAFVQGPTLEADRGRFERVFRPWPKWVLRICAELWHVDYPTIDREVFFQAFRGLNVFIFRGATKPEAYQVFGSAQGGRDVRDVAVLPLVLTAVLGHACEHLEAYRKKLDEALLAGKVSRESYEDSIKLASPDVVEDVFRANFEALLKDKTIKPQELTYVFEEARRKTFDKDGRLRESPLIPVYRVMFSNWIMIENMSGPKELTEFLSSLLGNQEFEDKYERVKAICKRMRVKFRPLVKGR